VIAAATAAAAFFLLPRLSLRRSRCYIAIVVSMQGALFKKFRDLIMAVRNLASVDTPTPQECIGGRTPKDMVRGGTSNKRLANEWTVVMNRKRRSSNTANSDG
jgi:hypothetical protein